MHGHRSDDFENASGQRGWAPKRHLDATKTCLAFNCKLTNRAGGRGNEIVAALHCATLKTKFKQNGKQQKKKQCAPLFPLLHAFPRISPLPPTD